MTSASSQIKACFQECSPYRLAVHEPVGLSQVPQRERSTHLFSTVRRTPLHPTRRPQSDSDQHVDRRWIRAVRPHRDQPRQLSSLAETHARPSEGIRNARRSDSRASFRGRPERSRLEAVRTTPRFHQPQAAASEGSGALSACSAPQPYRTAVHQPRALRERTHEFVSVTRDGTDEAAPELQIVDRKSSEPLSVSVPYVTAIRRQTRCRRHGLRDCSPCQWMVTNPGCGCPRIRIPLARSQPVQACSLRA